MFVYLSELSSGAHGVSRCGHRYRLEPVHVSKYIISVCVIVGYTYILGEGNPRCHLCVPVFSLL